MGDGPITGATLVTYKDTGQSIATFNSDATAKYVYSLETQEDDYPLTIIATGGVDLVTGMAPDFELTSTVLLPQGRVRSNVNPHSTIMVGIASLASGGITANRLASARTTVLSRLNFGLDPQLVSDPIGSEITDDNVAVMVKASETLGEMIRRTRDALIGTGVTSADDVIAAISADLTDALLDGRGDEGSDPRIAAIATLVSAEVLVEALTNELYVYGAPAADLLDAAIATVRPSAGASAVTDNVATNEQMLYQVRVAVQAAAALTGDPRLDTLITALDQISSGSLPDDIDGMLPGDAGQSLADAVSAAVLATEDDLETVNAIVRTGGTVPEPPPLPANLPPQVLDVPDQTATVGEELIVEVLASDLDGPFPLLFSAQGLPSGAEFVDEGNGLGRLYWSPTSSQVNGSPYTITFTATDDGGAGLASSVTAVIRVEDDPAGSQVTATLSIAPDRVDLTESGTSDWIHWGRDTETSINRKATGGSLLGNYSLIGGGSVRRFSSGVGARVAFSWSDGTPVSSATDTATGIYVSGDGNGFELNLPVTTETQVLRVYVGGWQAIGRIEARLDGSLVWSETTGNLSDAFDRVVELRFAADAAGQDLSLRYVIDESNSGNVTLQAATLDGAAPISGNATLTWIPPTQRVDGSPLEALSGYEIRYGRSSQSLDTVIDIDAGDITSHTINGLASGDWFFAMTAIDTLGQRSPLSEVVSKVVP